VAVVRIRGLVFGEAWIGFDLADLKDVALLMGRNFQQTW